MTAIAARRYVQGIVTDPALKLDGAARSALPAGQFDWVGLAEPSAQELDLVRRSKARMRGLMETLDSIVETASLLEQHRQGVMTRQLAAWAAILAVPTAIAGIYGMNFDVMPELRWRYGYFAVLGGIFVICGGLWLRFRRIGWL